MERSHLAECLLTPRGQSGFFCNQLLKHISAISRSKATAPPEEIANPKHLTIQQLSNVFKMFFSRSISSTVGSSTGGHVWLSAAFGSFAATVKPVNFSLKAKTTPYVPWPSTDCLEKDPKWHTNSCSATGTFSSVSTSCVRVRSSDVIPRTDSRSRFF